ncbi:MAG: phosphoribosylanthranilate isomerase [Chloroflexi bacterium]|nr:MAG: phosphoribosylanthranilate isomerase [Chloroflexota bacterium]
MVRVKVCGIASLEDALAAVGLGADALGFVFAPSPRQVTPEQVADIVAGLPPFVTRVGVFVDTPLQQVTETLQTCGLDVAQLHGSESADMCQALFPRVIKAFSVKDESVLSLLPRYRVSAYLLDAHHDRLRGGTGRSFDWGIARKASQHGLVILSGGLNAVNVRRAILEARPYAVDVSSGVESRPGVKDHTKLEAFLKAVKEAAQETSISPATGPAHLMQTARQQPWHKPERQCS